MSTSNGDGFRPVRVYRTDGGVSEYDGPARQAAAPHDAPSSAPNYGQGATYGQSAAVETKSPPIAQRVDPDYVPPLDVPPYSDAPPPGRKYWTPPLGVMILAGAVVALISMGIRAIMPLWQAPMLGELGWSSAQFSIALATQNLLWGLFSPLFGALADRFGAHKVLIFGAVLQACGLWVMSAAADPTMFFLSAGVMIGVAQSAAGMGIVLGAIGRMVKPEHRTTAFGIITAASSAGLVVVPPIGRALLESMSWNDAFIGVAILSLPMIALAFLIRSRQEDGDPSTAEIAHQTIGEALGEAVTHRSFVLLTIGFFVCGFHVTFIGVHLPNYLNNLGLGWQLGASVLMIIGIFNVAACLAIGPLARRFSMRGLLTYIYIARSVIFVVFILAPKTELTVYLFAASLGLIWLSTVPPTQGLVAQMFGTRYMTMLFGIVFLSHQVGSFLGVQLGALALDELGSYDVVWYACVVLGILSAAFHMLIDERPVARLRSGQTEQNMATA